MSTIFQLGMNYMNTQQAVLSQRLRNFSSTKIIWRRKLKNTMKLKGRRDDFNSIVENKIIF
jgi:hypothetical protein